MLKGEEVVIEKSAWEMGYSIKYKYTPYGGPLIKSWGGVKENLSQGVTLVDVVSQGVGGGIVVIIAISFAEL